ncbi:hypothetical protein CTAYLR_005421 [Chrysophaeum taylorii]|uniref:Metallo-beta-lactamase domain-containing protein n=1 Tax=Chrysophaeum taylorii TaxID=2483200 RepID=A0AAD7XII4_9STRA|nr:hypothetical protein CTAYLR_005421 [Chrysophaeum taylorii]
MWFFFSVLPWVTSLSSAWEYTHLGINTQVWRSPRGTTLLVDPILVDELVFFGQKLLFRQSRADVPMRTQKLLGGDFDAIVLTQGWDDHAHRPTLSALAKHGKPVVGPATAKAAAKDAGLELTVLDHGGVTWVNECQIRAFPGALLGPPWSKRENSVWASYGGPSLYYEPHSDFDACEDVTADILVAPAVAQRIGGFDLVFGKIARGAKLLNARTVVALRNGENDSDGLLAPLIEQVGSYDEAKAALPPDVRFYAPQIGEEILI